jgi:hypothetical protein
LLPLIEGIFFGLEAEELGNSLLKPGRSLMLLGTKLPMFVLQNLLFIDKGHTIHLSNIAGSIITNVFSAARIFRVAWSSTFLSILFITSIRYYVSLPGFLNRVS